VKPGVIVTEEKFMETLKQALDAFKAEMKE